MAGGVPALAKYQGRSPLQSVLQKDWGRILREINYHAVFDLAVKVLQELSSDRAIEEALRQAIEKARELSGRRAILRHDVAGRIYHLLLRDIAKPLGTYYTSVAAATLLLRLALAPERWNLNWADPEAVGAFTLADFACGTGTLLMAAVQALLDNHLSTGQANEETRKALLKSLLEKSVWGFDVLQSALHITATTLALPMPEVMLKGMRLYAMPLGVSEGQPRLGSLEFLRSSQSEAQLSLFPYAPEGEAVTTPTSSKIPVELPPMRLICMNPPFTRSSIDNLLFGSVPAPHRRKLSASLRKLLKQKALEASVQAGLGAVFLAQVDEYLEPEGRIAFVLPKALLSGVSWKSSRQLLCKNYHIEYLIVSHDPNQWNFSENTDLSEVLLVARKTLSDKSRSNPSLFVNLWRNPRNSIEALFLSSELHKISLQCKPKQTFELWIGSEKWGEGWAVPPSDYVEMPQWMPFFAFAQTQLNEILIELQQKQRFFGKSLPLVPLGQIAEVVADASEVLKAFYSLKNDSTPTLYSALKGHRPKIMSALAQAPNAYLTPKDHNAASRVWGKASQLMINYRVRLNTQKVVAVWLERPSLGVSWWCLKERSNISSEAAKSLILWLNSSLGIFLMLGVRQETEGGWVNYKKPNLESMMTLAIHRLPKRQLKALADCFDQLCKDDLSPLSQIAKDEVRANIDNQIAAVLGIPAERLREVRQLLQREPILTLKPLYPQRK